MEEIDFGFEDDKCTIYRICFQQILMARPCNPLTKPKQGWSKLVPKLEDTFFWLVESGRKKLGIDAINKIIQSPDPNGQTCFAYATRFSSKITEFILNQDININSIPTTMVTPHFKYPKFAELMMMKNINPKVIAYNGTSEFEDWPDSFKNPKCKKLAENFPRSIHFVVEDTQCSENCPNKIAQKHCKSNLKAFFYANGPYVDMREKNKLGSGGFGSVFAGKWHEEDVAIKCIAIENIKRRNKTNENVNDFEKNIFEYRSQLKAQGSGVIIPYAMLRQQNQEKKDDKWVAFNYNVFIYPRYDCNLYELHKEYYHLSSFNDNILQNILEKCLIRK